jgi:hypothetical protein
MTPKRGRALKLVYPVKSIVVVIATAIIIANSGTTYFVIII